MPRILHTHAPLPLIDGVLVKHGALRGGQHHHALIDEARRRAREIVRRAEHEAEAIRHYAAAQGYRAGLRAAWHGVIPWLAAFDDCCAAALDTARDEIRTRLEASFGTREIAEFVVRRIFDDIPDWRARRIRICVPAHVPTLAADLGEWTRAAHLCDARIELAQDDRLSVECGDAVYLFDMGALAGDIAAGLAMDTRRIGPGTLREHDAPSVSRNAAASAQAAQAAQTAQTARTARAALDAIDLNRIREQEDQSPALSRDTAHRYCRS
ncbi:hypothetical protein [Pararobbsia silviterrae]|uniref:HrpE/YscL family type III secretion apparatus protein n=1 Tax=Pararobbsia silviterrae TaxID=1792498 RepID=A0A494XQ90_9BURK|nr:hypothetical protein [Pararobbsia silviterrae]RKP50329.1 hypothetical protein D7S86_19690 [Pararobbsia silviterrae]